MTNHEHDRDLIMALSEGSLDGRVALDAEAAIAECADCTAELELQRSALAALAAAPPVAMTELETARFRRQLDTALGHERTVIAAPAPSHRRFNWAPVVSVAAILLALVLVAPALQLLGGSDDSGADAVSLQELEDEAAGSGDAGDAGGALREALPAERSPVGTDDAFAANEAPASTVASSADGDTAAEDAAGSLDEQLFALWEAIIEADDTRTARIASLGYGVTLAKPEDDTCVQQGANVLNVDASQSYLLGEVSGSEGLYFVSVHVDGDETVVLAHDIVTCAVVGRAPDLSP